MGRPDGLLEFDPLDPSLAAATDLDPPAACRSACYLNDRLADGERNATRLLAEITGQGYTGGYNTLNRYLRPLRRLKAAALAELPPRPAPPAVRKVTGWITGLPSNLDPDDAERMHAIRSRCPELDAAVRHVAGFARMIKDLSGEENALTKWIGAVDADLPALRSFTTGLRRDLTAVVAGLTLEYSSGAVEGTVNRVGQTVEGSDVRPRETRPAPQADTAGLRTGSARDVAWWSVPIEHHRRRESSLQRPNRGPDSWDRAAIPLRPPPGRSHPPSASRKVGQNPLSGTFWSRLVACSRTFAIATWCLFAFGAIHANGQ